MSTEEAAIFIETALRLEVAERGQTFIGGDELRDHIFQIAELFTKPTHKFGLLFIFNQIVVDPKEFSQIQDANMLGIDDLGEEEPALMSYGNRITPVIDLLSYRYCRMLFTMVTTNLTPVQIRSVYGDRIADRFNEMMLILPYRNPSFRTPQSSGRNVT